MRVGLSLSLASVGFLMLGCGPREELSLEQAQSLKQENESEILARTVSRPGGQEYEVGRVSGTFVTTINNDPKTFNTLTARDADTRDVVDPLFDYLAEYDPYERRFIPNLADFEVVVDEEADKLSVIYTLRDDLYWTTPGSSRASWVKVTSDDVVFWYDEVEGDKALQNPGYAGQFIDMPDGSRERIQVEKIDERTFAFRYPRIVANPILSTNMQFGPRHLYEPAKRERGVEGMLNLLSVETDPSQIPSIGPYHIVEYTQGVRVVLRRNPNYWKKDRTGTSYPYIEEMVLRIVPDKNTEFLLFKEGEKDSYAARPEDLEDLLGDPDRDYEVFNGGETLDAAFFTFNQNPAALDPVRYKWFTQTEFRQAMSCLLNRERIAEQVYRGLATPARHFFARPNPFFDEDIKLHYTYDPEMAVKLLESVGFTRGTDGLMYDEEGNHVEFDIHIGAESNISIDTANIFADELAQVGITANVRPIDFQKLVEMLTSTYDWHVVSVRLGPVYWPESGSNVWLSSGNFHLWRPLQEEPATEWEARIDRLYNAGRFTMDREKAKEIYDEYQRVILEQLPLIYIVHPLSFMAVRDRWSNVYYDTLNGLETDYLFLPE